MNLGALAKREVRREVERLVESQGLQSEEAVREAVERAAGSWRRQQQEVQAPLLERARELGLPLDDDEQHDLSAQVVSAQRGGQLRPAAVHAVVQNQVRKATHREIAKRFGSDEAEFLAPKVEDAMQSPEGPQMATVLRTVTDA